MPTPSQKAREYGMRVDFWHRFITGTEDHEAFEIALDSFTIAEETTISREISRLSEVLHSYEPTPEEEKG